MQTLMRESRSSCQYQPARGNPTLCTLPVTAGAVPALRRFTRDTARRWGLLDETEDALCLIVTELATNTVLHSGSPHVTLLIDFRGNTVTVQIQDAGRWRLRLLHGSGHAECGRGLQLVHAYATTCTVLPTAAGTLVIAELTLPRASSAA